MWEPLTSVFWYWISKGMCCRSNSYLMLNLSESQTWNVGLGIVFVPMFTRKKEKEKGKKKIHEWIEVVMIKSYKIVLDVVSIMVRAVHNGFVHCCLSWIIQGPKNTSNVKKVPNHWLYFIWANEPMTYFLSKL